MLDDDEDPDLVDTPEIDAGRALGVSGRGTLTPRGQDVSKNTGILRAIDPMKPISAVQPVPVIRAGNREVLDPSSIATTGRMRSTAPGDYDNAAARERWKARRPFTSEREMPAWLNPENDQLTDRQLSEQRHAEVEGRRQAAAAAKQQRDAQKLAIDTENSSLEADFRGSGKQFYTDPLTKKLTPIIDSATGRELYHATDWTKGTRPDGKTPAMVKRNKFGETEYKSPPIVHNPDLTDDQLYYDMGDEQIPVGKIDDLINHADFSIAKQARTARRLRTTAMWKEASAGAQEDADMATAALKTAQEQELGMQGEMETLSAQLNSLETNPALKATQGGFLGIGAHPAPAALPLLAMKQQLQTRMDALGAQQAELANQISPRGPLARDAKMKTLSVGIMRAKAKHVEYSQLADDRRAILKQQGIPEAQDENLQSILRAQAVYGGEAQKQTGNFQREFRGESATVARPAGETMDNVQVPAQGAAEPTPEPFLAKDRGSKAIGSVGIDEFARRYGDGRGPVKPDDLLKLYRRSKDIEQTLANENTDVDLKLRDQFAKEKDYIDKIASQRLAKLPADQQKRIAEVTRDPTWWDAIKGAGKSVAEAAAAGGGAILKGIAQLPLGPMGDMEGGQVDPEIARKIAEANATPQQRMENIKSNPVYQLGNFIQEAARESYAKNPHEDEGAISQALNAAAGAAGGFAPLIASGPAAPLTIGLQTAGDDMQRLYDEQIQKGVDPQTAADFAQKRALASGAVQAALFEILPKPLQKAGNRLIVDKVVGNALSKFLANRLAQGAEGAVLGAATHAAGNVVADRPLTEGVGEAAEGLGAIQAVMPRHGATPRKPGEPPAGPPRAAEPPAPPNPADSAIDRINKGIVDQAKGRPSSAAEAAEVFEPALKERENAPPPAKSAAESAGVFEDVATTEEANAKVGSQQEQRLQQMVDEVATATGRPREEIIATRQGKTPADWMADLEYQKDPIRVDPDRRISELNSDLKSLDAEWKQHVERTGAEADRARATEEWMTGIKTRANERTAMEQADRQGTADRQAQRAGDVEAALSEAERVRRSPKSVEGLRKDLTAQSQPTTKEAQLLARRAAIKDELVKAERTRQSNRGGADLKNDLAERAGKPPSEEPPPAGAPAPVKPVDIGPRDASVSTGTGVETAKETKMMEDWRRQNVADAAAKDPIGGVAKMSGKEFHNWVHGLEDSGLTEKAHELGIDSIGKPDRIAEIKRARDAVDEEFKKKWAEYNSAPEGKKMALMDELTPLTSKRQYFNEAASAAENIEGAAGDAKVKAAHQEFANTKPKTGDEIVRDIMAKNPNADARAARQLVGNKKFEVLNVPISAVGDLFGESTVQPDVVAKYAKEKSNDPIVLSRVEGEAGGKLRVVDGKHRFTAAKQRGDKTIRAWVPIEGEAGAKPEKKTSPTAPTPPTTPSVKAESAGAATVVGSPATGVVDSGAPASKPKGPSRSDIAKQTKLVREMTARIDQLAQKYPDRVGELQKQATAERNKLTQMQADKQTGTAPSVGTSPNGEPDLISDIADLVGTIRTENVDRLAGESDGISEAFSRGAARLLRGKNGMAPDQAMEILNEAGYKFKSIGEMVSAVESAVENRRKIGASMKLQAYEEKVTEKVIGGKNPKANGSMPIEEIGVGGKFKVDGEKFSIVDVEETPEGTWEYVVKDGVKFRVPEGTRVFPDARSVRGKVNKSDLVEFIPEDTPASEMPSKPATGELIPENEQGFNLASDEQRESAAPAPEGEKTTEMFGNEVRSTPPTEMDKRNAAAREMTAPVSAHVESHSPETLEGEKLNRNWTAFAADAGSLNVPRAEMPQIKSEHRGALVNFLKARGITAGMETVDPSTLKPTQAEYSPQKVEKARNFEGSERPILISADGHVVDGHHQWMAALEKGDPIGVIKLNAPIDTVLADMKQFPSVEKSDGARTAAKLASPVDTIIGKLESLKIGKPGMLQAGNPLTVAWDGAIDFAILGIRTGRAVADMVKMAVERFKSAYPKHTPEDVTKLEEAIHSAAAEPAGQEKSRTKPSAVPTSLREAGAPVEDIQDDVRAQDPRKSEAADIVARDGRVNAETMIGDTKLPGDTRVAIGGNLINERMLALQEAKPDQVPKITADIQRITAALQKVGTSSGQTSSMFGGIYKDVRVASAMEYVDSVRKKQDEQLGPEGRKAAEEAAAAINAAKTDAEKIAAIEKLKKKFSTKPATRMLNELQRIEKVKELNRLGVLTADDLINVAGNAIGIPGIDQKKLQNLAQLAHRIDNAKNHAERSRAELELADMLNIYKGVNPMDLEASILTLNILSGYTTQMANLGGNFMQSVNMLGTTAIVNPRKVPDIVRGILAGLPEGLTQARAILQTGRGTRDFADKTMIAGSPLETIDYARDFGTNEKAGAVLTTRARAISKISRFMKAADATFYYPAREAYARLATAKLLEGKYEGAELRRKIDETLHVTPAAFESARAQATQEGYEGIDLARRTSDIIEERRAGSKVGAQAVEQSEKFASEATYTNEPVGFAGFVYRSLANMVQHGRMAGIPVLKPWMMFLRTPANVFNATMNFTPLGAIRAKKGMQGETNGSRVHFTADERHRMYVQSLIGTAMMAGAIYRILHDKDLDVSAAGPDDPNKKRQLQASGWLPYGVKLGNKWYSYRDSPLLVPLAIIGHVADSVKFQKSKSDMILENKVTDSIAHAPQIIFQTSMLSGLADLFGSLSGRGNAAANAGRTLGGIPANLLIPYNRLLQQIDQTFDNQTYDNDPVTGSVPFLRRTGTPQTDVQGRPNIYNPMARFGSEEKNDPVDMILRSKNIFIPEVGKDQKLGNGVMTDEQRDRMRQFSGQRIRVRLRASIPILRTMNQENAQKLVNKISEEERNAARRMISIRPASPK